MQGEGGVHVAEPSFILRAQELCRERGVLLVIDEVQTGFGRTGGWFACSRYGLSPDILCLAKGIAGGFPMGGFETTYAKWIDRDEDREKLNEKML